MTALYPIHVLPATDLYVYGLDAPAMQHGIIVTNDAHFREFVREVKRLAVEEHLAKLEKEKVQQ